MSNFSNDVSGGGAGFGFGGGVLGAVLIGALLPRLFNDGRDGRRDGDNCGLEGRIYRDIELADLRKEVSTGKTETVRDAWALDKNLTMQNFGLQKDIFAGNANLMAQMAACCCETQKEIIGTAFKGEINDLKIKADTDAKLCGLAVGQEKILAKIEESRLIDVITDLKRENSNLREVNEKQFATGLAAKNFGLTNQLGDALKSYYALATPTFPFPWSIPTGYNY